MIGRQLVQAVTRRQDPPHRTPRLTSPHRAPRRADARPLRACACDVDLAVFGHTQCPKAAVQWPDEDQP